MLAECTASLALLTQQAMRFTPAAAAAEVMVAENGALAVAAAEALLPLLLEAEPGAAFPTYMAAEYCAWNAANALLRICSAGTEASTDQQRPSAPTFR